MEYIREKCEKLLHKWKNTGSCFRRENVGYTGRCSKATEEETDREDRNRFTVTFENGKESGISGGIYHKIQIELTYNSNHIEGSRLTHDQTRYIFETNTIGIQDGTVNVDDIVETANHFTCIDLIIEQAHYKLSEAFIKQLHAILKSGTSDSRKSWFAVGDYKRFANEVGGSVTTKPEQVAKEMRQLLKQYNADSAKTLEDIIEFHYMFEKIHPFQDGNVPLRYQQQIAA